MLDYNASGVLAFGVDRDSMVPLDKFVDDYRSAFYLYDLAQVQNRYLAFHGAFQGRAKVHYAIKANANREILTRLKSLGSRLDVVSSGEIKRGLECGFRGEDIIFSGVGKSLAEIEFAIKSQVRQINAESVSELKRIDSVARRLNLKGGAVPVALRVNPAVNPQTHPYIATGFRENKFGIAMDELQECFDVIKSAASLEFVGYSVHIGSQLLSLDAYEETLDRILDLVSADRVRGVEVQRLDLGGGLGILYDGEPAELEIQEMSMLNRYARMVLKKLKNFEGVLQLEPGRFIVGHAGLIVCQVQVLKSNGFKNFAIVDTGMHHLMRPALYQSYHKILPLRRRTSNATSAQGTKKVYDVVGPICESSDVLGKDRLLSELHEGDYLVIADTGAYGFSMSSNYNLHGAPEEKTFSSALNVE